MDKEDDAEEADEADGDVERSDEGSELETEEGAFTFEALVMASTVYSALPLDDEASTSVDTALAVGLSTADGSTTPAL